MHPSFDQVKEHINKSTKILLTTHERTDGDDLGTVLAIYAYLISIHKKTHVVIRGGVPKQLQYLPNSNVVEEEVPKDFNPELVIYSGCSKKDRCNIEEIINLDVPTINLDHHPDNTNFADVNIVDSTKSSVAELTYDLTHHIYIIESKTYKI